MSDILDKLKTLDGIGNGTQEIINRSIAEIKRLRAENDGLRKHNEVLTNDWGKILRERERRTFLDAAKMAEAEPMPAGLSPFSFKDYSVEDVAIATVEATRKSIAAALRRAAEGAK